MMSKSPGLQGAHWSSFPPPGLLGSEQGSLYVLGEHAWILPSSIDPIWESPQRLPIRGTVWGRTEKELLELSKGQRGGTGQAEGINVQTKESRQCDRHQAIRG